MMTILLMTLNLCSESFSHGVHVGSIISQLNDGIDGNGFGARVTPFKSL